MERSGGRRGANGWRQVWRAAGLGTGVLLAGYGAAVARAWARYGRTATRRGNGDAPLDRFMPRYDVVEHHEIEIEAPAGVVLEAARTQEFDRLPLVRGIFAMRQWIMGGADSERTLPTQLVPQVLALGWRVLDEVPGREVVIGAVTRPWHANVVFEGVEAAAYAGFDAPAYVKIVWSLRADPIGPSRTRFSTETRAVATDAEARRRFRRYWALASPGIWLIRRLSLAPLKRRAERLHLAAQASDRRVHCIEPPVRRHSPKRVPAPVLREAVEDSSGMKAPGRGSREKFRAGA